MTRANETHSGRISSTRESGYPKKNYERYQQPDFATGNIAFKFEIKNYMKPAIYTMEAT